MVDVLTVVLKNALREHENVFRKWRVGYSPEIALHAIVNAENAFEGGCPGGC